MKKIEETAKMNKISTKPISSPGRTDKFPPPLLRFLRSNAGSRSRGRSRSTTTIFIRKKNNAVAIETQEPSSPKVTCMGQVRVNRSSAKRVLSAAAADGAPAKFWWLPNPLFCHRFAAKFKSCSSSCRCQPVCSSWGFFFRRKDSNFNEDSTKSEQNFRERPNYETVEEEEGEETEQIQRASVSSVLDSCSTSPPPRNALLLMRCRSAPYRSFSLSSRFCGSPLSGEETEENRESNSNEKQRHCSNTDSISEQDGIEDPKFELKLRFFRELEDSLRERIMESEKGRELKRREGTDEEGDGDSALPVVLTRCKSAPARTNRRET